MYGSTGAVWYVWFEALIKEIEQQDPEAARKLVPVLKPGSLTPWGSAIAAAADSNAASSGSTSSTSTTTSGAGAGASSSSSSDKAVPYRAFLRSSSVQALMFTHFCNNWWVCGCVWV